MAIFFGGGSSLVIAISIGLQVVIDGASFGFIHEPASVQPVNSSIVYLPTLLSKLRVLFLIFGLLITVVVLVANYFN